VLPTECVFTRANSSDRPEANKDVVLGRISKNWWIHLLIWPNDFSVQAFKASSFRAIHTLSHLLHAGPDLRSFMSAWSWWRSFIQVITRGAAQRLLIVRIGRQPPCASRSRTRFRLGFQSLGSWIKSRDPRNPISPSTPQCYPSAISKTSSSTSYAFLELAPEWTEPRYGTSFRSPSTARRSVGMP